MPLPVVAIVGAPNVGKSSLFNRLVGGRRAIVTDQPGMTRDRLYGEVHDAPSPFLLVDTGGLTPRMAVPFAGEIEQQAEVAMAEARLILFVVDARAGATALDRELADRLRRSARSVVLVANKVETDTVEAGIHELHSLGLGPPFPVSAEHGRAIEDLVEIIGARLGVPPESGPESAAEHELRIAIVGRPNVGKSSLVNRLLGEERVVVSEVPGTTRDAIDTPLVVEGRRYRLIDTAGMRRPGRIQVAAERFSVIRARQSLERSDVAVLVLDAAEPMTAQDAHVAGAIHDAYRPLVIALNKWDLVTERETAAREWAELVRRKLRFVREAPVVLVSARTGQRVLRLLEHANEVWAAAGIRVPTTELNRWLEHLRPGDPAAPPPRGAFRLYYATQTGVQPPSFVLFCNDPARAHFSVRRQIENSLRERFGFGPVPLRLVFRGRGPRRRR